MPRRSKQRPSPASESPSVGPTTEEIEKDLNEAEEEAAGKNGSADEPEEEESDDDSEEAPPPDPTPEVRRGRRGRPAEATINVAAKGDAGQVRKALAAMTGVDQERASRAAADAREREEEIDEDADLFAELLQDPRHMVVVSREFPKVHRGVRTVGRCDKHHCPITLDSIKEDTFSRFGGRSFRVTVHPNTTTGEAKTIASIVIENPDGGIPLNGYGQPLVEEPVEMIDPVDPMLEDDPDPMARLDHALNQEVDMVTKVGKIKSARKLLKTLREDDDGNGHQRELAPQPDPRVAQLEKRITDMTVEQRQEKRMERLEALVIQALDGGAKKPAEDSSLKLLVAMMQSSDAKFQTMMTTFIPLLSGQGKKTDDLDSVLTRLAKVKEVLGGENPKVKSIESRIMEKMMDRFLDGDGGDGSVESGVVDVAKTAIKEGVPVIRALVDQRGAANHPAPTVDEFRKAVAEQAQKIVESPEFKEKLRKEWEDKGFIAKLPDKSAKNAGALPAPGAGKEKEVDPQEEQEDMDTPPSPASPNYDRKLAVDFVLDTMIEEMKTQDENGFIVGDIMDRLDDEILGGLLNVSSGEDLEKLIGAYADPAKLTQIKTAGQLDPAIKNWLSTVILGAQKSYRAALDEAKRKGEEAAKAAEAPKK